MHEGSTQSRWLWCKIRGIAIRFGYAMEYREVDRVSESSLGDSFVDSTIGKWRVVCCATQSTINCTWTRCNRAYVACRICPLCCFLAYQLCSEKRINASRMEIIEFTISWRIVRNDKSCIVNRRGNYETSALPKYFGDPLNKRNFLNNDW